MNDQELQDVVTREGAKMLDCKHSEMNFFHEADPFNKENVVIGALCRIEDKRYGALFIHSVNNVYCPQIIYAMPKLHYPFSAADNVEGRKFRFPACEKIIFKEKYDGSNIVGYTYKVKEEWFATYKTRLTPFLKASRFGDWIKMWNIMLQKYPIHDMVSNDTRFSYAFELYGKINPHLISYEHDLDTVWLLTIEKHNGKIHNQSILTVLSSKAGFYAASGEIPEAKIWGECLPEHAIKTYRAYQDELESRNKARYATNQTFEFEGLILNTVMKDDTVELFKLKPSQIEDIHFAAGRGLSKEIVQQACYKIMENGEDLSLEKVLNILRADWTEVIMNAFEQEIKDVVGEFLVHQQLKEDVIAKYNELKLDIMADKAGTMRAMSQYFSKDKIGQVFKIISNTVKA